MAEHDDDKGKVPAPATGATKKPTRAAVGSAPAKVRAKLARGAARPAASAARTADLTSMLLPIFHAEAEERLRDVEANLKRLASGSAGAAEAELVHSVMRDAHSIKGGARTVGLKHVEDICRGFEAVAHSLKEGRLALQGEVLPVLNATVTTIRAMLTAPESLSPPAIAQVLASLAALEHDGAAPAAVPLEATVVGDAPPPQVAALVLRGVVCAVGGRWLVVPTEHVDRALRVRSDEIRERDGRETIDFADVATVLLRASDFIKADGGELGQASGVAAMTVLIRSGRRTAALVVDDIVDEREVVCDAEEPVLPAHIARGAHLDAQSTGWLLDVGSLLDAALGVSPATETDDVVDPAGLAIGPPRCILVAEDSATSRILLKEMLESAGYEVTTAVDGVDALSLLDGRAVDLVVSDVEMPNLDGFGLTERIRHHPRHGSLPVILVTGRERPEDRARGMDAGANAYFVKSRFDENELLTAIEQFL